MTTIEYKIREHINDTYGCESCFYNDECQYGAGTNNPFDCNECAAGDEADGYRVGYNQAVEDTCNWLFTQLDNYLVDNRYRAYISKEGIEAYKKEMLE